MRLGKDGKEAKQLQIKHTGTQFFSCCLSKSTGWRGMMHMAHARLAHKARSVPKLFTDATTGCVAKLSVQGEPRALAECHAVCEDVSSEKTLTV